MQPPSEVLVLKNLIHPEELIVKEEYDEIMEDMKRESAKFGRVVSIQIPKFDIKEPSNNSGVGNVFIQFANLNQAKNARRDLVNRHFRKRIVEASYHSLGKFLQKDYQLRTHYMNIA